MHTRIFKKLVAFTLAVAMLCGTGLASVLATTTGGPDSGIATYSLSDYDSGDVEIINNIIENNGLKANKNDPDSWGFAIWTASAPYRVFWLDLNQSSLTGALDVSGLASLETLYCANNNLKSLDLSGLTSLESLEFSENPLESFPTLPASLKLLNCRSMGLESLPPLPAGLETLACPLNKLKSLPDLPAGLTLLYCGGNSLESLPPLPKGLTELDLINNRLTSLDLSELNKLTRLLIGTNPLKSFTAPDGTTATITSGAHGQVLSTSYDPGTQVLALNAKPDSGYRFGGWSVAPADATYTQKTVSIYLTLHKNTAVGATFAATPSGSSDSSGSGTTTTATATATQRAEADFWRSVEAEIKAASKGTTLEVDALGNRSMPYSVLEALLQNGVGMNLAWTGGSTIVIPAGGVKSLEDGRIFYPLSLLAEIYAGAGGTASTAPKNPQTGR